MVLSEVADIATWAEYKGGKIVYDLIDSYLAIPPTDLKQLLRGIAWFAKGRHKRLLLNFRAALERMCRRADAVVCTTDEQRQLISKLCPNVHIVLDLHNELRGSAKVTYKASTPFNVVWEGLPSNIYQLEVIRSALREVAGDHPLQLTVVTDPDQPGTIPWLGRVKTLISLGGYLTTSQSILGTRRLGLVSSRNATWLSSRSTSKTLSSPESQATSSLFFGGLACRWSLRRHRPTFACSRRPACAGSPAQTPRTGFHH